MKILPRLASISLRCTLALALLLGVVLGSRSVHAHDWHGSWKSSLSVPSTVHVNCFRFNDSLPHETTVLLPLDQPRKALPLSFGPMARTNSAPSPQYLTAELLDMLASRSQRILVSKASDAQPPIPTVLQIVKAEVEDVDFNSLNTEYCNSEEYRPYEMVEADFARNTQLPLIGIEPRAELTEDQQCVAMDSFASFVENAKSFRLRIDQQLRLAALTNRMTSFVQKDLLLRTSIDYSHAYAVQLFAEPAVRLPHYAWVENSRGDMLLVPELLAQSWRAKQLAAQQEHALESNSVKLAASVIRSVASESLSNVMANAKKIVDTVTSIASPSNQRLANQTPLRR